MAGQRCDMGWAERNMILKRAVLSRLERVASLCFERVTPISNRGVAIRKIIGRERRDTLVRHGGQAVSRASGPLAPLPGRREAEGRRRVNLSFHAMVKISAPNVAKRDAGYKSTLRWMSGLEGGKARQIVPNSLLWVGECGEVPSWLDRIGGLALTSADADTECTTNWP